MSLHSSASTWPTGSWIRPRYAARCRASARCCPRAKAPRVAPWAPGAAAPATRRRRDHRMEAELKRAVWAGACMGWVLAVPALAAEQQVTAMMHTFNDSEQNRVETYLVEVLQSLRQGWKLSLHGALDRVL